MATITSVDIELEDNNDDYEFNEESDYMVVLQHDLNRDVEFDFNESDDIVIELP